MSLDSLLIPTKFAPPRISPQTTPRSKLLSRLKESQDCRLTLVCGSAGFGKTTLLAQWRQELLKRGEHVCWLSLSPEEQQLPQFRTYLMGALQQAGLPVDTGTALPSEARAELPVASTVATIIDAVCQYGKDIFLFIDDYHHADDASTHALIQGLLDHGPDELHLILASRTHPPLTIGRMRMTGELTEISFPELPFDFHETQDFLGKHLGDVTPDDMRLIHEITDGWPMCVQMICIRLKRDPTNRTGLSQMLLQRNHLQRYLSEDVMRDLPQNVADFLEMISICRRFNADLAQCVSDDPQARTLLDQLERDNLLLLPVELDSPSPWYRLHPLFANFLQERLSARNPELMRKIHSRASYWFERHGSLTEALRHAYHANDLQAAARLAECADLPIRSMSFISTLQRWMNQLSADVLMEHPRLLIFGCWALVATCHWRDAQAWLNRLQQVHSEFALHTRYLRASIALQRDDTDAALSLVATSDFNTLKDRFLRQAHLAVLSLAYCAAGRYADARALHRNVARLPRAELLDDMALVAESTLLLSYLLEGTYRKAIRIGSALVVRAEQANGRRSVSAVNCAAFTSDAYYEADRLSEAHEVLANRLDLLRFSSPEPMIRALIVRSRLVAMQTSPQEALHVLSEDEDHCREQALDRPLAHVLAEQARLHLLLNHLDAAQELQTELNELADRHRNAEGFMAEIDSIAALAAARLALKLGQWEHVLTCIQGVRRHGIAFSRQKSLVLADLISGVALTYLGRASDSRNCLVAGVEAAKRLGLVRTLLDEGDSVVLALRKLQPTLEPDGISEYLAKVVRVGDADCSTLTTTKDNKAEEHNLGLKPREIEILCLLGQSMSNKRIALTLNITLETVKWNLKGIFGKLGVSSRYDAVVAARKRGLID
ncbi:helix-turn-helix transcriptional regulator [Pseudomonas japonica]|uniref:LuxR family transcriptional regulator, maltose regulon positive regulatory protein n=1 Tax=Pseudomonas japonica TaxID=256466 RepID=A0A239A8T4_9PSED|nr:AAA family ATPase [Pseudomonas japonica]SNR92027.1 LuxR family transcriptional regulator, maltose regulon positive regulatory protein [Pseudomonas japonica]